jgi:N-acetylmuramoyl-L-alanine amidase
MIGADTGEAPASATTAFTTLVPSDTDRVFPGRPTPAGGYGWFFFPRTPLEVTGRSGGFTRVRLDSRLEVWVDTPDLSPLPENFPAPRRVVGAMQVNPAPGWTDIVIPIGERPAYRVEERERALVLTLYDTRVSPQLIRFLGGDSLVRNIVWEQETTDRARLTIELSSAPYGYLALWERGAFTLRVRRPPVVADPARPLAGLTIVVDAGHPPAGATGPTGLYEGDLVLPVAQRVEQLLAERGATVVMTRTTLDTLALGVRPIVARQASAHALVSIHLNALPDGVNPFRANGTSTLFFHPHAEPLARAIQAQLVRRFRIRDLGVHYQNIALGRPTWMPAVLAEGLFVMMPEQEYAVSTPQGQELYARGIVEGLEDYFRAQWTPRVP